SATRLDDDKGLPIGIVAVNRDFSDRKEYERQLKYHASLQDNVSYAVIVTDMNFMMQRWNKAAERIYGWTAEEVIGKQSNEIIRTQFSPDERERSIQQLRDQGWWNGEVIQHHKDGRVIHIWGSVTLIKDKNGIPFSVVAVNHDISERKQVERKLQQRESWYRVLAQNLPLTSVFLFDS